MCHGSDCETAVWPSQSGFSTITVNVSAFAHWKKGAAYLTKQTRATAGWPQYYYATKDFFFLQCFIENVISDQRYQTIHWACAECGHTAEIYSGKWYNNNGKWKLDSLFCCGFLVYHIFHFGLKIRKYKPVFNGWCIQKNRKTKYWFVFFCFSFARLNGIVEWSDDTRTQMQRGSVCGVCLQELLMGK